MATIDDVANEPRWTAVSEVLRASILPPPYLGTPHNVKVVVKELANGLLYAVVQNEDGKVLQRNAKYNVEGVPALPSGFRLIQLDMNRNRNLPGYFATFEYKAGKAPDKNDAIWIEYITWHSPQFGNNGLTMLISLYASHIIKDGWLNAQIGSIAYWSNNRSMKMNLGASDQSGDDSYLDGRLVFNGDGKLLEVSLGLPQKMERMRHPLSLVYNRATNGMQIDVLSTAAALVKGFPSSRHLDIVQLVQYKS